MPDFDRIREVKASARDRLLAIPGVHCVAIGSKKTAGEYTNEHAIVVFVTKKRQLDDLEPGELIPSEIEGVKVDVVESPMPRLHKEDPVRGGIQIQSGGDNRGEGTLGFIVQSSDGQKIYAVTNQHVVAPTHTRTSLLDATPTPGNQFTDSIVISFKNHSIGAIATGTVVAIKIRGVPLENRDGANVNPSFSVVLPTPEGAQESDVATAIMKELNATGLVTATLSGTTGVTVKPAGSLTKIIVEQAECKTFGGKFREDTGLTATVVANAATSVSSFPQYVIQFKGQALDPGGAYVNLNIGGPHPSHGFFVPIAAGDDAAQLTTNTVAALNKLIQDQQISAVQIVPGANQITVNGADEIECEITKDDRVGAPTNCFCARHHQCCSNRIGTVVAAATHVDAALILLDGGQGGEQNYARTVEIEDGRMAVAGTRDAKVADHVQTYGSKTGHIRKGTVVGLHADGIIGFSHEDWDPSYFHRYYRDAIFINKSGSDPFSQGGDSGSAVMGKNDNDENFGTIVGLLFGGGADGHGLATPIADVLKAFADFNLVVSTTTNKNETLPVPGPSYDLARPQAEGAASPARAISGGTALWQGLHKAEVEIEATPAGKELSAAVRRHVPEGYQLVTTNRRVGAVWKRNGGQQIFPAMMRLLQDPAARLPDKIGGRSLAECLTNIRRIFERYGSPDFVAELRRRGDQLIQLMSLSYSEAKAVLESAQPD